MNINLESLLQQLRKGIVYKNYCEVRDTVVRMIKNEPNESGKPSVYWQEELEGFEYMFDASPFIVARLRHHCYHLTGLRAYDYRSHHQYKSARLEKRLQCLRQQDTHNLFVPEPRELGGFGYATKEGLYNIDTLKFYECLIGMQSGGLLDRLRDKQERKIVLEVGSGWGGFTHQIKTLFPHISYILVDLPPVLLFAATYLKTLYPRSRHLLIDGTKKSLKEITPQEYDFIYVPHYRWQRLSFQTPDLLINMASFQEMTSVQVEQYVQHAHTWGIPYIYSWNRDHSPNNPELTTVSSILGSYYDVRQIKVLEKKGKTQENILRSLISSIKKKKRKDNPHAYQHLVGELRAN